MNRAIPLSLLLAGLVATSASAASRPEFADPAAQRGERFAQARCGGCHAVRAEEQGRNSFAPSFASLHRKYSTLSLEARLTRMVQFRHRNDMPPVALTEAEARDLVAYIDQLDGR